MNASPENRPEGFPSDLRRLMEAGDPGSRDEAWRAFLQSYSRLLLHTARGGNSRYDAAMDRYTHVLEQLRRDDFRRLRAYVDQGRGKFTTWLVVVAGRLCRDFDRQRYGRFRPGASTDKGSSRMARRRLVDLVGEQIDPARLPATHSPTPEGIPIEHQPAFRVARTVPGRLRKVFLSFPARSRVTVRAPTQRCEVTRPPTRGPRQGSDGLRGEPDTQQPKDGP